MKCRKYGLTPKQYHLLYSRIYQCLKRLAHPEKTRADSARTRRAFRSRNLEKVRASVREYQRNRRREGKYKVYWREYISKNPEKAARWQLNHQAKLYFKALGIDNPSLQLIEAKKQHILVRRCLLKKKPTE